MATSSPRPSIPTPGFRRGIESSDLHPSTNLLRLVVALLKQTGIHSKRLRAGGSPIKLERELHLTLVVSSIASRCDLSEIGGVREIQRARRCSGARPGKTRYTKLWCVK